MLTRSTCRTPIALLFAGTLRCSLLTLKLNIPRKDYLPEIDDDEFDYVYMIDALNTKKVCDVSVDDSDVQDPVQSDAVQQRLLKMDPA